MRAGRFVKTPDERKQYTGDYTDWLAEDETLTDVEFDITPTTDTPLTIDGSLIDGTGKLLTFFVSGGEDRKQYKVVVRVTTSSGQIEEDLVVISLDDL